MDRGDVNVAIARLDVHIRPIAHPGIDRRPASNPSFQHEQVRPFGAAPEPQVAVVGAQVSLRRPVHLRQAQLGRKLYVVT
jgi:hypothetical protein